MFKKSKKEAREWFRAFLQELPGRTGAVVTRSAAPFSVIAGIPARIMSVRGQLAEGVIRDSRTILE